LYPLVCRVLSSRSLLVLLGDRLVGVLAEMSFCSAGLLVRLYLLHVVLVVDGSDLVQPVVMVDLLTSHPWFQTRSDYNLDLECGGSLCTDLDGSNAAPACFRIHLQSNAAHRDLAPHSQIFPIPTHSDAPILAVHFSTLIYAKHLGKHWVQLLTVQCLLIISASQRATPHQFTRSSLHRHPGKCPESQQWHTST
jgi:hypothetical protein